MYQVTIVFLLRHPFNTEIKKHGAGKNNIQTIRHAMTLAQEAEIKLKIIKPEIIVIHE